MALTASARPADGRRRRARGATYLGVPEDRSRNEGGGSCEQYLAMTATGALPTHQPCDLKVRRARARSPCARCSSWGPTIAQCLAAQLKVLVLGAQNDIVERAFVNHVFEAGGSVPAMLPVW